jgi:DNA polymerase III alpha subunit (gram-positive type)
MLARCLVLLLVALLPGARGTELPPFAVAAKSVAPTIDSPAQAPDAWLLAFVDVETTGLVPGWHEMIDIGVVLTELNGREVDTFFQRIQPRHPERLSEGARRVNAFDAERWNELGAVDAAQAVLQLREFHVRAAQGKGVILVAFNSQFDAAFLDHLFRGADANWRELYHYFVLDVPSMAWALGLRGLTGQALADALQIEDEPRVAEDHTGLTGARLNARLYRALEARRLHAE